MIHHQSKHVEACKKISATKRKPFDSRIQRQATVSEGESGLRGINNHQSINSKGSGVTINNMKSTSVTRAVGSTVIDTTSPSRGKNMSLNRRASVTMKSSSSTSGNIVNSKTIVQEKNKSNWREQHEQFIRTVRAARGVKIDELTDEFELNGEKKLPSGYIQCPTCDRSFNRKAAERHIEWCGERKSFTKNHRSSPQSLDAMAKFKARSTYKPPIDLRQRNNKKSFNKNNDSYQVKQIDTKRGDDDEDDETTSRGRVSRMRSVSTSNLKEAKSSDTINLTCSTLRRSNGHLSSKKRDVSVDSRSSGEIKGNNNNKQIKPNVRGRGGYFSNLTSIIPTTGSKVKAFLAASNKGQVKAPIVKFKDKFPLAAKSNTMTSTYMATSDTLQELLKRPVDNENYSKQPKTVPGVRTGGMSPIKSASVTNKSQQVSTFDSLSLMKRSLDDLMLYNSQNNSNARNSIGSIKSPFTLNQSTIALFNDNKSSNNLLMNDESNIIVSSVDTNKTNETGDLGGGSNSIDSGLRGSTSGSSGEDQSIDGRKASLTVSEESAATATVAATVNATAAAAAASRQGSSSETNLPRWCHQCGTKYPMQGAKYCYECGARRLGTIASLV